MMYNTNKTMKKITALHVVCAALVVLSTLIYAVFKWVLMYFGAKLDAEALFFTLTMPIEGTDIGIFWNCLKFLAVPAFVSVVLAYGYFRLINRLRKKPATNQYLSTLSKATYWLLIVGSVAYLLSSLYYIEHRKNFFSYLVDTHGISTMFEDHYHALSPDDVSYPNKKNIILIMLESIEDTYSDENLFGENLIPALTNLKKENIHFDSSMDTRGANWTFGALVAFTTGIPLTCPKESALDNFLGIHMSSILPNASSILNIMESHGYNISFFLGSAKEFAGQDKLFYTHSKKASIYDAIFFNDVGGNNRKNHISTGWGVDDSKVYDGVKEYLAKYNGIDHPFFIVMQTIDTHSINGHFQGIIKKKYGDLRDCVLESDILASNFVEWLKKQPFYKNTAVIILGDHLLMHDTVGPIQLPDFIRRHPYNVFINTGIEPNIHKRNFAAFDFAPTILYSSGARWAGGRLGLGVNLFDNNAQTLFEEFGEKNYSKELRKKSALYNYLISNKNKKSERN